MSTSLKPWEKTKWQKILDRLEIISIMLKKPIDAFVYDKKNK